MIHTAAVSTKLSPVRLPDHFLRRRISTAEGQFSSTLIIRGSFLAVLSLSLYTTIDEHNSFDLMIRSLSLGLSFLAIGLISCSGQDRSINDKIRVQVQASSTASLDLTLVGPNDWERVCIFGPYTSNELIEADLGFKWDAESESSIAVNDGINLIVFTRGKQVLSFAEHSRGNADFGSEERRCTLRANAKLARSARSDGVPLFTMPQ